MTSDSAKFGVLAGAGRDVDLVHAAKNGDTSAFDQLVGRYDHNLLRIAQHVTHNREDAQEAVQEVYERISTLGPISGGRAVLNGLIRITVNQSLMKLRKQRSVREISLDEDFQTERDLLPIEVADWAPNPEELYRSSELRDILTKTLEYLQPILRTVFVLRDIGRAFNRAGSRRSGLDSNRGEGAVMAGSVAAS